MHTQLADSLARIADTCAPPDTPSPSAFVAARHDDWSLPNHEDDWEVSEYGGSDAPSNDDRGGGQGAADPSETPDDRFCNFNGTSVATVCAVDCGMATLGSTEHGVVVACRAASTTDAPGGWSGADLARTGPIHLRMSNKGEILHRLGADLGEPTFYVTLHGDGARPVAKPTVAATPKLLADRLRAYAERLMQAHALSQLPPGAVLLLDGAMTKRSRDTPTAWWTFLANTAAERGVSLVAISKQSEMVIGDRPVAFWLSDHGPGYRCLTHRLRAEQPARADRILGNLYAIRWGVGGPALRLDVLPAGGRDDRGALDAVAASVSMRGGMPEPLVRAHALTYITRPAFSVLQADAVVSHNLNPAQDERLGAAVWGFSAGRFK